MNKISGYKKNAVLLTVFLLLLCLVSLAALLRPAGKEDSFTADIYQNGILIMSIPLNEVSENRSFTIEGENGCVNEIEVRQGSICILSADCPDKLCVRQGFISDSTLPITCLPNRLVIRLRPGQDSRENQSVPDIVTY